MSALPESFASEFRRRGFARTGKLFDDATVRAVREEIERIWAARLETAKTERDEKKAGFVRDRPELQRLHIESPLLSTFVRSRPFDAVARALMGPEPDADMLWNQAYVKAPGGHARTAIPWHQDGYYAELDGLTYNCWVALTHTTIANGTVWCADAPEGMPRDLRPHDWDAELLFFRCEVDESYARPMELEPGEALVFDARVPHRSGPNVSGDVRVAYAVSFAPGDAKLRINGQPFGDRLPVLRGGARTDRLLLAESVRGEGPLTEEIARRAPTRSDELRGYLQRLGEHARRGDGPDAIEPLLGRALALLPPDEQVFGDTLGARTRPEQLIEEADHLVMQDRDGARRLLLRALELEPGNKQVRARLAALNSSAPRR